MATLGTFLIPVNGQPAVVDPNGEWHQILGKESIALDPDEKDPKDVSVTATIIKDTWTLPFSSIKNAAAFGSVFNVDALENNAWVGDAFNSGVMALSLNTTDTPHALGDIFTAFGIIPSSSTADIADFLATLGLNTLQATIHNPTTPAQTEQLNALWCVTTSSTYEAVLRLSFDLDVDSAKVALGNAMTWINNNLGVSIDTTSLPNLPPILITLTRTDFYTLQDLEFSQTYVMSFQFSLDGFSCAVDFSILDMTVLLLPPPASTITNIYDSIKKILFPNADSPELDKTQMPSGGSSDGATDLFAEFFSHIALWYVKLGKSVSDAGTTSLSWAVAILAGWTVKSQPILFGLSYESKTSKFVGRLVLSGDVPSTLDQRMPDYDRRIEVPSATLQAIGIDSRTIPPSLNLWELFTDHGTPPKNLPFMLTAAQVSYQTLTSDTFSTSIFTFYMDISGGGTADTSMDAPSGFVWNDISVLASLTKSKPKDPTSSVATQTSTSIQIHSNFTLYPKDDVPIDPAFLQVSLEYDSSGSGSQWILEGSVDNLSVALLADWFDTSCRDGAMAVLGRITLRSLDMNYTYVSGSASSFLITAILELGGLELDLMYQYVSASHVGNTAAQLKLGEAATTASNTAASNWTFEAVLRLNSPSATIASIAESIVPGSAAKIPTFVGGISVAPTADPTSPPVKLLYTGGNAIGSVLIVWVSIGAFNLTFVQYQTPTINGGTAITKRILRISIDQIPLLDDVPLVNQLPQPFDHLVYLWVEDADPKVTGTAAAGFTRALLVGPLQNDPKATSVPINLNDELTKEGIPVIQFKDTKKTPADGDLLLQEGHHFIVVANGSVVLDHVFHTSAADTTPASTVTSSGSAGASTLVATSSGSGSTPAPSDSEAPVTKGDTNTKAGPLSVSGLSLQYKNGSLFVGVDATLVLGPLTFAVIGFTIEIEILKVKLDDLSAIITDDLVHFSIHGLEVGVSKEPLTLEGVFVYDKGVDAITGDSYESYRGGIAVGFKAWDILAVGEYKVVTVANSTTQYKSVFVYGKLDGPLVELEFATISGVRLGFGFNSTVYLPSADLLYTFPFINDSSAAGAGNDPMQVLNNMIVPKNGQPAYVSNKEGGCWFCAGMTITCFDCVTLTAVLMFEVDTTAQSGGCKVALLADGVFQMEPLAPPDFSLFYIEVLIKVELDFTDGYIAADAVLAPASHVYVPQAHLTGGASFYSWFPPNSHAGDWVVTIGGYNKGYKVPSHYPVPSRLGLSFTVGDDIQIVGQGYAAVTPKCAMAGGSLHMSLGVGPVSAYCDIILDVFVNFKPFYFIAQISLSVGVECQIDILFIHIHVSVSIGADLTLWGPDSFGGLAHVDFWFFGFDIRFGDDSKTIPGITLEDFYEMVRTPGPASTPPTTDTTITADPYITQHKYSIESGLFPSPPKSDGANFPNTGAATEWIVQPANLQIRIDFDFALSSAVIVSNESDRSQDYQINLAPPTTPTSPTSLDPINSFPMHSVDPILSTLELRIYSLDGPSPVLEQSFKAELVLKNASTALWSLYHPWNDPLVSPNPSSLTSGDAPTILLCQAVRIFAPVAVRAKSPIVDFDATAAMKEAFEYTLAAPDPLQTTYLAAPPPNSAAPWPQLGDEWAGKTNGQLDGVNKASIRGDDAAGGGGMLGLCADALGWSKRPSADKVANVVVVPADGRMEWVLKSDPPPILVEELGDYYPALPLWTSASA